LSGFLSEWNWGGGEWLSPWLTKTANDMTGKQTELAEFARRLARMQRHAELPTDNPFLRPLETLQARAAAAGRPFVNFSHYDYLGLSGHPAVRDAAKAAIDQHGVGAGASRLVGGERLAHGELERELAGFFGFESALALISGYLTNESIIRMLVHGADGVFYDDLSHNSIMAGVTSGRFHSAAFPHNDLDALDRMLGEKRGSLRNVLVVVEGLYSMDGDIPDLPRLLELKDRHGFWLMIDEAHSLGVLGPTGRGIAEHFGVDQQRIDISVGTFSKAFVSAGGFILARRAVIDLFRFSLPGFVYSVGLPPPIVAAARAALSILEAEPGRVAALAANTRWFIDRCAAAGLPTGSAVGHGIVPVLFDSIEAAYLASHALRAEGIYAPPVIQIGVPRNAPRIRFFVTAAHSFEEIDRVVDLLSVFSQTMHAFDMRSMIAAHG
jgi:8-amino-7-oxononanoate synthase